MNSILTRISDRFALEYYTEVFVLVIVRLLRCIFNLVASVASSLVCFNIIMVIHVVLYLLLMRVLNFEQ